MSDKAKTRHARGGPVLVRFADGPMADRHMTVQANQFGMPPSIVNVAYQEPEPVRFDSWRTAPTIGPAHQVLTYHLLHPLDTVPWSYLYKLGESA